MAVISEPYKRLNILIMVVKILGNSDTTAYKEAERVVKSLGLAVWNETYFFVDVAIAPLLIGNADIPSVTASVWQRCILDTLGV